MLQFDQAALNLPSQNETFYWNSKTFQAEHFRSKSCYPHNENDLKNVDEPKTKTSTGMKTTPK